MLEVVKPSPTFHVQLLVLLFAGLLQRDQQRLIEYLLTERDLLLRKLGGSARAIHWTDAERQRLARAAHNLGTRLLRELPPLVHPDTLVRWYRELVARKHTDTTKRGPGRPRIRAELVALIVTLAKDNHRWGYTRIVGEMKKLGLPVARSTVQRVLQAEGLEPSPQRARRSAWAEFLQAHVGHLAAMDFFSVEVLTPVGLVRHLVLFFIDVGTREVHVAGIVRDPGEAWMMQTARNLTAAGDGLLLAYRVLILDRDPLYTAKFREMLENAGVKCLRLPPRSPNLNAFAERFIGSARRECLNRVIPLGEAHLRWLVREYTLHYNAERPHQGIGNVIPRSAQREPARRGPVVCKTRLGGILKHYERKAA